MTMTTSNNYGIIAHLIEDWGDAMKREMDLCRAISLKIEESDDPESMDLSFEGYTPEQINYHLKLLQDAGLIDPKFVGGMGNSGDIDWVVSGLTWKGHDFAELTKDVDRWEKAKETVLHKTGTLILDFLLQILFQLAKQRLGIPT
jgi:DNA-binding transcriptional ArsR family regulator